MEPTSASEAPSGLQLRQVCSLQGHEERIWSVAWRPMAKTPQFATCGADRSIRIWGRSAIEGEKDGRWGPLADMDASDQHNRTLRSVAWNRSGDLLAVACFDSTTSLWRETEDRANDDAMFECVGVVSGHENEVKAASFSPSGDFLASCSRDKSVWIYETPKNSIGHGMECECVAILQSHTQDVKMVKWHPEQDILFSCSYDDTIKVWGPDGDDWGCKATLGGHKGTVWSLAFDAVGSLFVTCSDDRTLRVWAPTAEKERGMPVAALAYVSPLFRAGSLAGANPSGKGRQRQAPADASCPWKCVATIEDAHPRPIYSVDVLPFDSVEGSLALASACGDNHVRVFCSSDGGSTQNGWSCVADVEAHFGDVNAVAWCPTPSRDGSALLASVGDDAEVMLWRFG